MASPVKVINRANLPSNPPIMFTCIIYLMLEHFNVTSWVQGTVWTIVAFVWICAIIAMINQKVVSPKFED